MQTYDGSCELIVDTNAHENELAARIEERGVVVKRATLKTGDVALVYHGMTILAERKSVDDLASGIAYPYRFTDGQRARLAGEAAENTNTISILLLHGPRPDCNAITQVGFGKGVSVNTFYSVLQMTMLKPYNIPVIHSPSLDGLAFQVVLLRSNLIAGKFHAEGNIDADAKPPSLSRKRRIETPADILMRMLVAVPGCSATKAAAIVALYPNLTALISAPEAELSNVMVGKCKLGPVMAKRLRSVV